MAGVKKRSGPQGKKTSDKSNDNIRKKKKVILDLNDDENDFATIGLSPLKSQTTTIHLDTPFGNPQFVCPPKLNLQFGTYTIPGDKLPLTQQDCFHGDGLLELLDQQKAGKLAGFKSMKDFFQKVILLVLFCDGFCM